MILIPKYKNLVEVGGSLSIVLTDSANSQIKQEIYVPNLVVTTGKEFIASRMVATTFSPMSHMAIGTGSTTEDIGDTALETELTGGGGYTGYSRAALSIASATSNVVTYSANFPANNPSAPIGGAPLREAGIFNASTAGTMLCRTTFPLVTKLPADALTITWTITIQ
jgi:hypothetical protein